MGPSIDTTDLIIMQPNLNIINPKEKNVKPLKIIFSNLVEQGKIKFHQSIKRWV
ncbi:hypothetical protein Ct9H90mP29_21770 [bacterium]|nr:MAG: hypothetical protein Ct9H90mP29_21770 [bacterium]